MNTQVDEIAERVYRFSTFVPEIAAPAGFSFNQYLIDAEEPLLFHCGPRHMFPLIRAAFARVRPSSGCAGSRSAMSNPTNAVR